MNMNDVARGPSPSREVPTDQPGEPIELPPMGRREFFFLTLSTMASGVVVATLSRPCDARTVLANCTAIAPNVCSAHNDCDSTGNTCTRAGANSCTGIGANANTCKMWNLCEGGSSANTCINNGGATNLCTPSSGTNQCDGATAANSCNALGVANDCGGGASTGRNVCYQGGASNSCSAPGNSCGTNVKVP